MMNRNETFETPANMALNSKDQDWRRSMCREVQRVHRQAMRKAIFAILQERQEDANSKTVMILETTLFEKASSLGDYIDRTSLRRRLRRAQEEQQQQESHSYDYYPTKPATTTTMGASAFSSSGSISLAGTASTCSLSQSSISLPPPTPTSSSSQIHLPTNSNSHLPWQQQGDYSAERRRLTLQVFKLLEARFTLKGQASSVGKATLLQMSKGLEVTLYRQSKSLAEYQNTQQLRKKLVTLLNQVLSSKQSQQQAEESTNEKEASSSKEETK
uniref:Mediator complex subunit 15 KIX domain-containing protein n=1 Tax=Entomoneis paludosa TaxID=265537 RepID=A0A7S3DYH7_9STRA